MQDIHAQGLFPEENGVEGMFGKRATDASPPPGTRCPRGEPRDKPSY